MTQVDVDVDDENGSMGHFDAQEATCEDLLQLNDICDEIISSNLIEEAKEMLQGVSDFKSIAQSDIVPRKDMRNCGGENDDEISVDDEGSDDGDVFEKEMDYIPDESDESDTSCMDEITKVVNIVSDTPSVHEYVTEHQESLEGNKTKQIRVRKDDKKIKQHRSKHPILPPCSCAKNCIEMIPENERKKIHSSFWSFSYNERKMFIYFKMSRKEVKRRKSTNKGLRKREMSFKYFLQGVGGIDKETLVFKSHKILQTVSKDSTSSTPPYRDQRGGDRRSDVKKRENEMLISNIRTHIQSYEPSISHFMHLNASTYVIH